MTALALLTLPAATAEPWGNCRQLPEGSNMTIKSDRWIQQMAREHGMIEPFEAGQVRQRADGTRLISYGTSSYGYDVRCADEFKIFTNINSSIVDPKQFDERSFVDYKGDVLDPYGVTFYGFLAYERVADELPREYRPE